MNATRSKTPATRSTKSHRLQHNDDMSPTRKRTTLEHMLHMFMRNRIVNKAYLGEQKMRRRFESQPQVRVVEVQGLVSSTRMGQVGVISKLQQRRVSPTIIQPRFTIGNQKAQMKDQQSPFASFTNKNVGLETSRHIVGNSKNTDRLTNYLLEETGINKVSKTLLLG